MVKSCEPGDVFGELALLYNCPRAASVEARDKCVLWQLDRDTFNGCVKVRTSVYFPHPFFAHQDAAAKKREKYEMFLSKVPLLQGIDSYERSQVSKSVSYVVSVFA
jgi:cAMP-dependent protein kinase regulator